ncbi:MAG: efflux transporter outer membrane subunit [Rhodanobacter sp.]
MSATYLTVSGNVVNTLIAQAAYLEQIGATEELIALQSEQLDIARAQADAGTVPYSTVLSVQSQLASSRASIPALRQRVDQADHLLASLAARTPAEWQSPKLAFASLSLPRKLPLSLPSALVRQRPDILSAEAQLHIASANIGVTTAALFPTITLSGAYGRSGATFGSLEENAGKFWSVGPDMSFPLFEGGTLRYRNKAAIEAYRKSLADYRQAVLAAFAQVADTLTALEHDAQAVQAQGEAVASAEQALHLLQANYRAGLVGYVDVLIADAQFYQARIAYLQAKAQRYQDTTALFLALGGGWQDGPLTHALSDREAYP